jgi:cation:H+ antiporter
MTLTVAILLFLLATIVIVIAGTQLTKAADKLADKTGMGEALLGAIFLGGVTSIPGIVTSVVAAYNNHPQLAISNAIGGIAAQTVFLSIADISYRRINLEHAAASFTNLMQGVLLMALLAFILIGLSSPQVTVLSIHPLSIVLILVYFAGSYMISRAKGHPMWNPRLTKHTVKDVPNEQFKAISLKKLLFTFIIMAILVAGAGYTVSKTGITIAEKSGLSEVFVGTLFTAVATSLPELIVSIAAVRQKALTLAVGNIIGGNTFDVLFVAFADMAYAKGSILHAISANQVFIIALTMVMISILILGLLFRERKGIGRIGWESSLIIAVYLIGNLVLYSML